ncbi:MAG: hypothetical protein M5U34_15240 [Chloroflexi bacterium]|nr:hypothetical protein [Chloroflexota bacterium]
MRRQFGDEGKGDALWQQNNGHRQTGDQVRTEIVAIIVPDQVGGMLHILQSGLDDFANFCFGVKLRKHGSHLPGGAVAAK